MASLFTNQLLPTTSEQAIREFNEKYLAAISAAPAPTWADRFVSGVSAPRVTYPMSIRALKFLETKEESSRFKTMVEQAFDLKVVEYDAGYEANALDLTTNAFAYRNWSQAASDFAIAESRHVSKTLNGMLENGTTLTSPWDGVAFFSASHLSNPKVASSATFSNYQSVAADAADPTKIQAEATAMRGVLDPNGNRLGVDPDEIWVPVEKYQFVNDKLAQNLINGGETNPLYGKFKVVPLYDATDVNDWYLVDSKMIARGVDPMIAANYRDVGSLGLRVFDEASDFYKNTGKLKISAHIWYGFGLVFPHAIRKVVGA